MARPRRCLGRMVRQSACRWRGYLTGLSPLGATPVAPWPGCGAGRSTTGLKPRPLAGPPRLAATSPAIKPVRPRVLPRGLTDGKKVGSPTALRAAVPPTFFPPGRGPGSCGQVAVSLPLVGYQAMSTRPHRGRDGAYAASLWVSAGRQPRGVTQQFSAEDNMIYQARNWAFGFIGAWVLLMWAVL